MKKLFFILLLKVVYVCLLKSASKCILHIFSFIKISYVEYLKMKEPTKDLTYLICHIAKELNKVKHVNNAQGISFFLKLSLKYCFLHMLLLLCKICY